MQRRAHESTSGVPVQWPVSVVQKPLGLRQSEKIPSKNFRVQRLEMAKQMKDIRQQCVDEQDKAAQIFTWCMVVAMHQEEGIGATRLNRACNEMRAFQARYKSKIDSGNRRKATEAMRDVLRGICDFTVRLPQNRAPRNYREERLRMAQDEGAEIAWLVMAATAHLTFGFGKERLARLKKEAIDGYRQYIGWVKTDGEDCAEEWLKRCVEQALQEELEVNDIQSGSHPPKLYYSSGVNVEDMIRVMSAVSAKMAAERGIKRVPLAVLSQSEISRRMSAI